MTTTTTRAKVAAYLSGDAHRIVKVAAAVLGDRADSDCPLRVYLADVDADAAAAADAAWWVAYPVDEPASDVLARYRLRPRIEADDGDEPARRLGAVLDRALRDELDDGDADLIDLVQLLLDCQADAIATDFDDDDDEEDDDLDDGDDIDRDDD